jgi:hypothetical protein
MFNQATQDETAQAMATLCGARMAPTDLDDPRYDSAGLYAIWGGLPAWEQLGLNNPSPDTPLYVGKSEDSLRISPTN